MKKKIRKLAIAVVIVGTAFLAWFWILPNGGFPRTVSESVNRLIDTLPDDVQDGIVSEEEAALVKYHQSLGMHIRNQHGLWGGNLRLKLSICRLDSLFHADYASGYIIHALWKELRERKTRKKC